MSRKRVAAAATDRSSEIAVEGATPAIEAAVDLIVHRAENNTLDNIDDGDDEDEDEVDEDEYQYDDRLSPRQNELPVTPRRPMVHAHPTTSERAGKSFVPAANSCLRCFTLPQPGALPREVFAHDIVNHPWRQRNEPSRLKRMVRYDNPREILIYANALWCSGSERKKTRAGCAILTRASRDEHRPAECQGFILEQTGPRADGLQGDYPYNQKRAELRAVIAALENQRWASEGWKTVTIATKSAYVYNGMTQSIAKWKSQGWLSRAHPQSPRVGNADLWARAIGMVNEQGYYGCEVQLWLVSRDQNLQAEDHARWLAKESDLPVPKAYVPFVDPESG